MHTNGRGYRDPGEGSRRMKEASLVRWMRKRLEAFGFWTLKFHGSPFSMAGIPDLLAIRNGRAWWLEAKVPGKEPTKIQHYMLRTLARFGCDVSVVHTREEFDLEIARVCHRD
jgi:Holliday junction resolvase